MIRTPYEEGFARSEACSQKTSLLLGVFTIMYLGSFAFEGLIRFLLAKSGAASLLYLRDLIPIAAALSTIWSWIRGQCKPSALLITMFLISIHFFSGFFSQDSLLQQLFGIKVFLPLILGIVVSNQTLVSQRSAMQLCIATIIISCTATIINRFYIFPWEGSDFETVFGVSSISRLWWAGGERRIAGLARSSFDEASLLLILTTLMLAYCRSFIIKIILFVAAIIAVFLTTSKGVAVALIAVGIMTIISLSGRQIKAQKVICTFATLIVIMAPVISLMTNVRQREVAGGWAWWLSSYADRMESMWPKAFLLWIDHGNILTGRGPGGIGASQQFVETSLINAADNIFVYLTVTFGVLGWVYFLVILIRTLKWDSQALEASHRLALYGSFLAINVYGVVTNIMEQPILCFTVGFIIGFTSKAPSYKQSSDRITPSFSTI